MAYLYVSETAGPHQYTFFDTDGSPVWHATRYLRSIALGKAGPSVAQYGRNLLYFMQWVRQSELYSTLPLDEVFRVLARHDIEKYVRDSRTAGVIGERTLNHREVVLKGFLAWLATTDGGRVRKEADTPYRLGALITSAPHSDLPKAMNEANFTKLLNSLHNESERVLLHLMYDAGLRISEVCRLKNSDLPNESDEDSASGYLQLHVMGSKGRLGALKERTTILALPVLARVRRYHNSDKPYRARYRDPHAPGNSVFLTATGQPLTRENVSSQLKAAAKRAGLDMGLAHPHVMRHSFAVNLLLSDDLDPAYGNRRLLLKTCMGHSSLESGETYLRILPTVVAQSLKETHSKYEQAKRIYAATYHAPLKHKEKRGHAAPRPSLKDTND